MNGARKQDDLGGIRKRTKKRNVKILAININECYNYGMEPPDTLFRMAGAFMITAWCAGEVCNE